jgi:NAD(P)-dependent dehydrogenase (short-subunit alcohol dehydrogenase family)
MTTTLRGKTAIVTGASSGVGKATAKALVSEGVRLLGVARGREKLEAARDEIGEGLTTVQADASEATVVEGLLRKHRPDLVVVASGIQPRMAPIDEQSWETFSEPWNADTRTAFHFVKNALTLPLSAGSTVVVVSSGAAINGSPLSGGYSAAKRMQWLLAGYAQQSADRNKLGIRFVAVLPKQLIVGTDIGAGASSAYAAWAGISPEEFMKRFDVPLSPEKVGRAIVSALSGEVAPGVTAIGVTGTGVDSL